MLGDVLLIEDKHRVAGAVVVEEMEKLGKQRCVIAISGESGSGKSELAHVIARALSKQGIVSKPISTDNFYRVHPQDRTEWRSRNGVEECVGHDEYNWDEIERVIADFRAGRTSTFPCVDLVTNDIDQLSTDFSRVQVLVLEGLYSIKTPDVDLRVFIELTYHETKKAQAVRGKEPQNDFRMRVLEQEHVMVQSLHDMADIFVGMDYQARLNRKAA